MIKRCLHLNAKQQDTMFFAAKEIRKTTGGELPDIQHTESNLRCWSRTVRRQNAGRAIAMMIHVENAEQFEELIQNYEQRLEEEKAREKYWEGRDLYDAAVEAGMVHY